MNAPDALRLVEQFEHEEEARDKPQNRTGRARIVRTAGILSDVPPWHLLATCEGPEAAAGHVVKRIGMSNPADVLGLIWKMRRVVAEDIQSRAPAETSSAVNADTASEPADQLPSIHEPTHKHEEKGGSQSLTQMSRERLIGYIVELRVENRERRIKAQRVEEMLSARTALEPRLLNAELKLAAIAAGIVDPDACMFLDAAAVTMNPDGSITGADDAIAKLRQAKPHLFREKK